MSKVIAISQQKGGSGKTTIAVHLAIALSQKNSKVLLIDSDPQGSSKFWYQIRQKHFGKDYTGIDFLEVAGWKIPTEILTLKSKYNYIIIDSPPHNDADAKSIIKSADIVIIPMQASATDLWATTTTVENAKIENISHFVVLNRFNPNLKSSKDVLLNFQNNIFNNYFSNRTAFASCILQGKTVTETEPSGPASLEIKNFVEELLTKIQS
jgi:chromosome partitioning protein